MVMGVFSVRERVVVLSVFWATWEVDMLPMEKGFLVMGCETWKGKLKPFGTFNVGSVIVVNPGIITVGRVSTVVWRVKGGI